MLFVIEKQLKVYRQRIEELFARHPDHDLFGSLPGASQRFITQRNLRRSTMSAKAPAGKVKRKNGKDAAVDINDRKIGEGLSLDITQVAAQSCAPTRIGIMFVVFVATVRLNAPQP